jgi:hypothetical protein
VRHRDPVRHRDLVGHRGPVRHRERKLREAPVGTGGHREPGAWVDTNLVHRHRPTAATARPVVATDRLAGDRLTMNPECRACLTMSPVCRACLTMSPVCRACLTMSPVCHSRHTGGRLPRRLPRTREAAGAGSGSG